MNRRSLLSLLLALAALDPPALLTSTARADEGEVDDGGDDDGDSDDSKDSSDDGEVVSGSDGGDTGTGGTEAGQSREDDHDDALRAVNARYAIPLKQVLAQFERQLEGTVVDVTLMRGTNALRYRVKFIDPAGRVRRAYFDALTGALVR